MLLSAPADVRRGLVLMTDGADTICEENGEPSEDCTAEDRARLRKAACDDAKGASITIWVVAAMHADRVGSRLGRELRDCASDGDQHVFISAVDESDIAKAFQSITAQVMALRRTY